MSDDLLTVRDLTREIDRLKESLVRAEAALSRVEARQAVTAMVAVGYTRDEIAAVTAANRATLAPPRGAP